MIPGLEDILPQTTLVYVSGFCFLFLRRVFVRSILLCACVMEMFCLSACASSKTSLFTEDNWWIMGK